MILKSGRGILAPNECLGLADYPPGRGDLLVVGWERSALRMGDSELTKAEREDIAEKMIARWRKWGNSPCPYAGGLFEDGKLVGKHSDDCRCGEDGLIR